MKTSLTEFSKGKPFLLCVDSDGCAMDTMNIKHEQCFGPAVIDLWPELESIREEFLALWNKQNLYAKTRGINRFKGLVLALDTLKAQGFPLEDYSIIKAWVEETPSLSNPSLAEKIKDTKSPQLRKALAWSHRVNERIHALGPVDKPFEEVKEGLSFLHDHADVTIVSSANTEAVAKEWTTHGLSDYVEMLCGQEAGTKAFCIQALLEKGSYEKSHVLMVGDAPGDLDAARSSGVSFYPILPGNEAASWKHLREEAFTVFMEGHYAGAYEEALIKAYEEILT